MIIRLYVLELSFGDGVITTTIIIPLVVPVVIGTAWPCPYQMRLCPYQQCDYQYGCSYVSRREGHYPCRCCCDVLMLIDAVEEVVYCNTGLDSAFAMSCTMCCMVDDGSTELPTMCCSSLECW